MIWYGKSANGSSTEEANNRFSKKQIRIGNLLRIFGQNVLGSASFVCPLHAGNAHVQQCRSSSIAGGNLAPRIFVNPVVLRLSFFFFQLQYRCFMLPLMAPVSAVCLRTGAGFHWKTVAGEQCGFRKKRGESVFPPPFIVSPSVLLPCRSACMLTLTPEIEAIAAHVYNAYVV